MKYLYIRAKTTNSEENVRGKNHNTDGNTALLTNAHIYTGSRYTL